MKKAFKRYWAVCLVFLLVSAVCLLFSCRKSGMFIDEIYTYGLSNSYYAPYVTDIKGGSALGETYTHDELFDYLAVTQGEGFNYGSVSYDQAMDVHPPLYYWIFHTLCSLFPGSFTKWTGLALDYVIYMLCLLALYKLLMQLFGSRPIACAGTGLYGLSTIGLSTMLMIRMYVLLTLWSVLLAYLVVRMMRDFRPWLAPLAGLCILAGLLTQYYFVFYAFFLCAAAVLYWLLKKDWRALKYFVPFALGGALALLLVFPQCISQLTADKLVSGDNAVENLAAVSQWPSRILYYVAELRHGMKAAIYVSLLALLLIILGFKRLSRPIFSPAVQQSLVVLLPALLVFPLVAIIGPVTDQRYVYNIAPIFIVGSCLLLYLLLPLVQSTRRDSILSLCLLAVMALALWQARCVPPAYIYPEHEQYNALVQQHKDSPCVYVTDDFFAPITQDLIQLLAFDDMYVTNAQDLASAKDYVGQAESFVAYIDISEYWSSGYDPEATSQALAEALGYSRAEPLYQYGLSATYVISK